MPTETEMISAQDAAEFLNVSYPYLAELMKTGELKAVKIGRSLCINSAELRCYKDASMKQRKATLDELVKLSQELRLG